MQKTTLADAKARFSELVEAAEHKGVTTLITKHGKPSAMIVPVPPKKKKKGMTPEAIAALHAAVESVDRDGYSAVRDVIESRR